MQPVTWGRSLHVLGSQWYRPLPKPLVILGQAAAGRAAPRAVLGALLLSGRAPTLNFVSRLVWCAAVMGCSPM